MRSPVEDDVVDELRIHVAVVNIGAYTVETGRTGNAVGKETMVHRAVFATPLGTVGTGSFRVARVVKGFFEDTPLHGGIVAVVHRQVFLHRPGEGTVVEDDVVDVLYVEFRHALVRQVAGTEADMTHDAVRGQFHLVSSNADATARRCLSGNGQIGFQP